MSKPKPQLDAALIRAVFDRNMQRAIAETQGTQSLPAPVAPVDQLADTIPPIEPPELATTTPPRPFDVVRWHINPPRVTVEHCADLAAARAHVAALHYAAFYKYAIRDPRPFPHIVESGNVTDPDPQPFADVQFADNPPVQS